MISNPPYGKSWSKIKKKVMDRSNGRFDIGQPRTSDGQLLFTLHMVSKMKEAKNGGSAIAIVHNGSPLFSGDAGSGESKIREHVIANDLLETIVALPTQLFYNTGIATYIWILRNNKPNKRKGKIQLINAVGFWEKMSPSLGNKRRKVVDKDVARIIELHKKFEENEYSKIYDLDDFAYRKVSIELEELDEDGLPLTELRVEKLSPGTLANVIEASEKELKELKDKKKKRAKEYTFKLKKDSDFIKKTRTRDPKINIKKSVEENKLSLFGRVNVPVFVKDTELIPWKENREDWLNREVEKKWHYLSEKKGYEIPFTKEFYVYQPLRKLEEVLGEFSEMERENQSLLSELGIEL